MDTALILILAALGIGGLLIWLDARNQEYSRQYKADVEKGMDSLRRSVDRAFAGLGTEHHACGTASGNAGMETAEREMREKPVTMDSVLLALRKNGYSPENDRERPGSIFFCADDTTFMIEAGHLPFLAIKLGYTVNLPPEEQELMRRAA